MNETKFNAELRAVLRSQGLGVLHIREADQPGPADLVIWQGPRLVAWVELKFGDHDTEPHQEQFIKARELEGGNAYVFTLWEDGEMSVDIWDPKWEGLGDWVTLDWIQKWRLINWPEFFETHNRPIAEQS